VHSPRTIISAILLLAAAGASAQSGVSIYGNLDAGVSSFGNERGGSSSKVDTGIYLPNRFGFRGSEDLGAGMRAIFLLESGFNVDDGALKRSNTLFSRAAWVGLATAGGTVTLGHMPDFMYEYLRVSSNGGAKSLYFSHPGNLDNLANQFQIDNAIKYETPSIGGFTLGLMNGFGEQAGDASKGRSYSLGLRYADAGLRAAAAYTVSNNRALNLGAGLGIGKLLGQVLSAAPAAANAVYANFNADQVKSAGITADYRFGAVTPHALYTQVRFEAGGASATMRNADLGVDVATGGRNTVGASLASSRLEQRRWNQLNLIDQLALSKRTVVYAAAAWQRASGPDVHAVIMAAAPASGQSQRVFRLGVNHMF